MIPDYIGVVAIGRNEGARLVDCLKSLRAVAANIIYVDSGSSDDSVATAQGFGASVLELDRTEPFSAARARNEGFSSLRALRPNIRFVQFIDGDCILARIWIEKALAVMDQRSDVAIICGRRRERDPTASIYNEILDDEWNTPVGDATACGGDALVRVEAFERVGGFRPSLIAGEEPELCLRLREIGWKIWRLDAEMTQHDAAMQRFSQWWVRAVRCGYAYIEVSRLHRNSPIGIWRRETARAVFWGGVLPMTIIAGSLIHPGVVGLTLVYPLQIFRIAVTRRPISLLSWKYALFTTVAKLAEFQGILRYCRREWGHQAAVPIEYK